MPDDPKLKQRAHPKLRMMANTSAAVSAWRSELAATVATVAESKSAALKDLVSPGFAEIQNDIANMSSLARSSKPAPLPERAKKEAQPNPKDSYVNVIIELKRSEGGGGQIADQRKISAIEKMAETRLDKNQTRQQIGGAVLARRNMISATVPVEMIAALQADPGIAYVHQAEPVRLDTPLATPASSAPTPRRVAGTDHRDGAGSIVGIIDVGGFDFAHQDFLDDAQGTRFLSIWDQGGHFRPSPRNRKGLDYGSELTRVRMNAAIKAERDGGLPAVQLEQQSQMTPGSHGTHVASIAAGRSGVAPKADIVAVLISVPQEKTQFLERRATFTDSSRILHAIEYILDIAEKERKPVSINISLGTNGGAHDGSSGVSRWIDALLAQPGRAIAVAAGNAGQEKGETADDMGFVTGRIHTMGHIASRGLDVDLDWVVVGNGIEDMSENELEIWYGPQDRVTVMLKPPSPNAKWIEVPPQRFVENLRLDSGTTVSIYNELYHPTNGANYLALYLSPNYDAVAYRGVESGVWTVRLRGNEIRDGRFNAWIERDDPRRLPSKPGRQLIRFPSFFSERSNVDSHSVNSLGCGHRVTCVANVDTDLARVHITSSQGPTRDGRYKPDIAAAGTEIVAANGFGPADQPWIAMTGTSMASPYIAGLLSLMLAENSNLTSAQCAGILQRTARPLPGASYEWANDAGFGVVDPEAALRDVKTFDARDPMP